jgi:hypothetical protein
VKDQLASLVEKHTHPDAGNEVCEFNIACLTYRCDRNGTSTIDLKHTAVFISELREVLAIVANRGSNG